MGQIERKLDPLTKLSDLMVCTPSEHRIELEIECNVGEN